MTAEIVSVGTELLLGHIADTNAQYLGRLFPEFGIGHDNRQTVGDDLDRLSAALRLALERSDLVFTIGGLGPTEDDLTRPGIAAALGEPLVQDESYAEKLRELFSFRGMTWTDRQLEQAKRPPSAQPIENPNGTAPGLHARRDGRHLIALPGPPGEFVPMVESYVRPFLASLPTGTTMRTRILRTAGMGEALVEEAVRDLLSCSHLAVGIYASPGEVRLAATASAPSLAAAEAALSEWEAQVHERIGDAIYGTGDEPLESVVLGQLRKRGERLAAAESCTGGLFSSRLTAIPGSSGSFVGSAVTYANEAKRDWLGVPEETLERHGAVSDQTAIAMARGCAHRFGVEWAVSITGIAGPGGGTADKPVGLVYTAWSYKEEFASNRHQFQGSRDLIRQRSAQAALIGLWRAIQVRDG